MAESVRWFADGESQIAYTSLSTVAWTEIGPATEYPAHQFLLTNTTDVEVSFTFDVGTPQFTLPPSTSFVCDITTNKSLTNGFYLSKGSQLWAIARSAPTTGFIFWTIFYGEETQAR